MNKLCQIRGVSIGEGKPKIVVPIIESTLESIIERAKIMMTLPVDLVEWRSDAFEQVLDTEKTYEALQALRAEIEDTPLIFSFRTVREGGMREITMTQYTQVNSNAARSGLVDLIDLELISCQEVAHDNIKAVHDNGVLVMGSYHNFSSTPEKEVMIRMLMRMQDMGADIAKIAVMPNSAEDLLTLLNATFETAIKYGNRPIVTTAMSPAGLLSRLAGEVFGSSMTYGAVGKATAPGQIDVNLLKDVLDLLHQRSKKA